MKTSFFQYGLVLFASCAPAVSCGSCRQQVRSDAPAAARQGDPKPEPTVVPSAREMSHDLTFELGAAEFFGGDQIEIDGLRGDRPTLEVGGRYEVRGRYRLQSYEEATILFSFTASRKGDGVADLGPPSTTIVRRGEGDFALSVQAPYPGYPHVTFYRTDTRQPFGGVYFGSGPWLLQKKSWRYQDPKGGPPSEREPGNDGAPLGK